MHVKSFCSPVCLLCVVHNRQTGEQNADPALQSISTTATVVSYLAQSLIPTPFNQERLVLTNEPQHLLTTHLAIRRHQIILEGTIDP